MSSIPPKALALMWFASKRRLNLAKAVEVKWRLIVKSTLFADATVGVNRFAVTDKDELKMTVPQNIKFEFDNDKMAALYGAATPDQAAALNAVFYNEVKMNDAAYKALDESTKAMLDRSGMIIIKDGIPSLELVPLKKEV